MHNIKFTDKFESENYNTFILVTHCANPDFVIGKISSITGRSNINTSEFTNMRYNTIKRYNFITNTGIKEIIVAGAGKLSDITNTSLEKLGGYIYNHLGNDNVKICMLNNIESVGLEASAAYIATGLILKSWTFDKYKTNKQTKKIESLTCVTNYIQFNEDKYPELDALEQSVFDVRTMVSEPANVLTPTVLKNFALDLEDLGVNVSILDTKDMSKLGMNALLAVSRGSDQPPYTVVLEYHNGKKTDETLALVGKGVTFDAGGICLKPAKNMSEMKGDMTGAAVVIGIIKSLALQQVPVNVVGAIGLVENTISGNAQKPGDVVRSMSGTTIEVDNTDAEGRLVLADVLWYVQQKYLPKTIVDFATLTGAIQVALGHEFAGYMSNCDDLSMQLELSSKEVGEKIWRLPLHASYEPDIKSDIADIKNVGSGRGAGSITAAMFLQHFIKDGIRWAHIDIAATEWDTKDRALSQKGATGFGVRLMNDFIKCNFLKND